jgi:predicted dehydrogenase
MSVCVPDKEHFGTLKMIAGLKKKPKLVICEKPITTKIEETEKIVRLYQRKKIPLLVDHTRRFDLAVQKVAKEIKNKRFGNVVNASAIYSNGVLHSGIHIIDLARFFFGEVKKLKTLYSIKDRDRGEDKTVGAFIEFDNCKQFYLMTSDERNFCFAEFDILCEKGRFRFIDLGFGLAEQKTIASPIYKGDIILGQPILKKTSFDKALLDMIDNAVGHLESGEPLLCDAIDAGKTQKVCLSLLKNISIK